MDVAGHVTAGLLVVELRAVGAPLPQDDPDWRQVAGPDPLASWQAVRARMTAALGPEALETARGFVPRGREVGVVGPERVVRDGADDQTRLLALFGRVPLAG
ncbi:hypothetical protein GCM10022254_12180 [Actinomadura meridiana]|uniref:Uncharacterized protein n=1 Tax=Actinomadura meridiana TaxID=559626 RepID=A0ABP8BUJ2_9ACTN